MGEGRQNANVWWWLLGRHKYVKRLDFFRRRVFKSPYLWQDSLFTHWNRLIGCWLRGHQLVKSIERGNDQSVRFCFNCYREVKVSAT